LSEAFEVAIIGAGPAGLGAALNAAHHKLSHVLFEKREVGNTVFDYQLRKHVMAEPQKLPLRSHVPFQAGPREEVLAGWNQALQQLGVNLKKAEVSAIQKTSDGFCIKFAGGECLAKNVVLSIGVQGSPRKLGVPGEEMAHVAYTLSDPEAFENMDIIVVGAGDAAIENALALMEKNRVSIVNRGDEFARAKDANNSLICKAIDAGKIRCFYNAEMARIEKEISYVKTPEGEVAVKCGHIIARIGAILPRKFLESCGIAFPNKDANSVPSVNDRFESNVPGLFVLGALIGYPLIKQAINQGHEVIQHIIGQPVEPADQVLLLEKLEGLPGSVQSNLAMIREALPIFKDLTEPQFRELIIESKIHHTKSEEIVFNRNDYTDTFFCVISGAVRILLPSGKDVPVSKGAFFGEMGLLSGRRRSATAKVSEAGLLLECPRRQIVKLISSVESVKKTIDRQFVRNALQSIIFSRLDEDFLNNLVTKVRFKNFKKGEALFSEGDEGDALYVIRKGSLKVSRRNNSGVDVTQAYVAAGNFVGEMALIDDLNPRRSATVSAAVACETLVIDKADFRAALEASSEVKELVNQIANERRVENLISKQTAFTGQTLDFIIREGLTDADNVLIIDSDLCVACDNCEAACAGTHGGFSRLDRKGGKSFASIQIPISCRHCENPLCMIDCPPDALTRLPDGEVVIQDSCIGCGNCARNCPYGVIQMMYPGQQKSFSLLNIFGFGKKKDKGPAKAAKCDQCAELSGGPACVRACPTGAAMRLNPLDLVSIISRKEAKNA